MKKLIMAVALLLVARSLASPQDVDHLYRGQGYVFIGEGSIQDNGLHGLTHVGGGGEVFLFKGLGIGSELGAMGRIGTGVAVFSIDPSYHFLRASRKSRLEPFVEGGYTRTFANYYPNPPAPANLFNFGGGFHYWAFKRLGFRLEFRDHVHFRLGYVSGFADNYWGLRIGLALR